MNFKVKITKIGNREDAYHLNSNGDGERIGYMIKYPTIGESFYMSYHDKMRGFQTSTVKEVSEDKLLFKTYNSVYQIEILEKFPDEIPVDISIDKTPNNIIIDLVSKYLSSITDINRIPPIDTSLYTKEMNESFDKALKYLMTNGLYKIQE
jgi:hypothetical protein